MRSLLPKHYFYILLSLIIFLLSIPSVYYLYQKPDLPVTAASTNGLLLITAVHQQCPLEVNDKLISVNGISIFSREDIELILDSRSIGEQIPVRVERNFFPIDVNVELVHFYSSEFLIIQAITVLLFLFIGLFVLLKAKGNRGAELFYLATLGAAVIMSMTWGRYSSNTSLLFILRYLFEAAYIFTPILFVHFAITFPEDRRKKFSSFIRLLYIGGMLLFLLNAYTFANLLRNINPGTISGYEFTFTLGRILLAVCVIISISVFFWGYFKTEDIIQRKKLKWLITGFLIGPFCFIVLWVIPQAVRGNGLIPEYLIPLLMLAIPVTFTISILKYHLLDIDVILKRSVIYFFITVGIFLLYIAIVLIVSSLVTNINQTVLSGISAILVAFLFNPLKNNIQSFVNKKFFRIQYNFREAVKMFISEMKEIYDINSLANKVVTGINRFIPIEKIALIDISDIKSPVILASLHFKDTDLSFLKSKSEDFNNSTTHIAIPGALEKEDSTYRLNSFPAKSKLNLILFSAPAKGKIRLMLAAGEKKSGYKYSSEDLDLLNSILNTASSAAERIVLQENLIRKELEAEKLIELNKQKSLFVSTVSHDLKTPLTSIRMYSELIKMNDEKSKINNFADYIEGESERLTGLINNVLNFSSIEKGIKEYHKEMISLEATLNKALSIMDYQLSLQHFTINRCIPEKEMLIYADAEALIEAFINLLTNAIKYSLERKEIDVSVIQDSDNYIVSFRDYGIGISEEEQAKLFTPYFRTKEAQKRKIGGTGLGLSIIKHIADAHNITIKIESKLSEGTTFKLLFPTSGLKHEEDINN